MLDYLTRLVARLRSSHPGWPPMPPPNEPDAGVRQPKWTPEPGGLAAAEVDEPIDDRAALEALGRSFR